MSLFDDIEADEPDEVSSVSKRFALSLTDLYGFHEDAAKRICELSGYEVRITRRNGRQSARLTDSKLERVQLHVDYCVVVNALIG